MRLRRLNRRLGVVAAAAVCAVIAGAVPAAAAPQYTVDVYWHVVLKTSTRASSGYTEVAAAGPHSAWALGFTGPAWFIMHWNGGTWRKAIVLPAHFRALAIAASAGNDIWVTGYEPGPGPTVEALLHWNGSSWSVALKASAITVVDISRDNVWVPTQTGLLRHWDGRTWTSYPYHYAVGRPFLQLVAAVGAQLWRTDTGVVDGHSNRLVIERWTGAVWAKVSSPHPAIPRKGVAIISASTPRNVWVMLTRPRTRTVQLLHWNGISWRTIRTPVQEQYLAGGRITAVGRAAVWVASGAGLWSGGSWHLSNIYDCIGTPVAVPRTAGAFCPDTLDSSQDPTPGGRTHTYGMILESGRR